MSAAWRTGRRSARPSPSVRRANRSGSPPSGGSHATCHGCCWRRTRRSSRHSRRPGAGTRCPRRPGRGWPTGCAPHRRRRAGDSRRSASGLRRGGPHRAIQAAGGRGTRATTRDSSSSAPAKVGGADPLIATQIAPATRRGVRSRGTAPLTGVVQIGVWSDGEDADGVLTQPGDSPQTSRRAASAVTPRFSPTSRKLLRSPSRSPKRASTA